MKTKVLKPPKGGSLTAWRMGFWNCRRGLNADENNPYVFKSPLWNTYNVGYRLAAEQPDFCAAWCFSQARLIELALDEALLSAKKKTLPEGRARNTILSLMQGWEELKEKKPWQSKKPSGTARSRNAKSPSPSTSTQQ